MADAGTGRHHREIRERLLAPFQELVALLGFCLYSSTTFLPNALLSPKKVHDHGVIDDEVDRHQRIDCFFRRRRRAACIACAIAARIDPRPVRRLKSCISTRCGAETRFHARACASSAIFETAMIVGLLDRADRLPKRSRFSSSTFIE